MDLLLLYFVYIPLYLRILKDYYSFYLQFLSVYEQFYFLFKGFCKDFIKFIFNLGSCTKNKDSILF